MARCVSRPRCIKEKESESQQEKGHVKTSSEDSSKKGANVISKFGLCSHLETDSKMTVKLKIPVAVQTKLRKGNSW